MVRTRSINNCPSYRLNRRSTIDQMVRFYKLQSSDAKTMKPFKTFESVSIINRPV